MKKKKAKEIKEIASKMGEIVTRTFEWVDWDGSDLLLTGFKQLPNGDKIEKDGVYSIQVPVTVYHSAEKALKRSFKKNGENGIYNTVKNEYDKRFPAEPIFKQINNM
jgi:hypothetical protein